MICPQCGKLIGVGEERCPFCGAWQPGMFGAAPALQRWFGGRLDLIPILVTACIVLYVLSLALDVRTAFSFSGGNFLGFLGPGGSALVELGATNRELLLRYGWWWSLLTASFLHGGLLHIFFNMMALRNLGPAVVQAFGQARAFVIFMIAGAVGFLVSDLLSGAFTIGASAGIFGMLAALIVVSRRIGHSMMTAQLVQSAVIMFAMGLFMGGIINNWAHAGGFVGGYVVAQMLPLSGDRRESPAIQIFAIVLMLATVAGFVLSFVQARG